MLVTTDLPHCTQANNTPPPPHIQKRKKKISLISISWSQPLVSFRLKYLPILSSVNSQTPAPVASLFCSWSLMNYFRAGRRHRSCSAPPLRGSSASPAHNPAESHQISAQEAGTSEPRRQGKRLTEREAFSDASFSHSLRILASSSLSPLFSSVNDPTRCANSSYSACLRSSYSVDEEERHSKLRKFSRFFIVGM